MRGILEGGMLMGEDGYSGKLKFCRRVKFLEMEFRGMLWDSRESGSGEKVLVRGDGASKG